MIPIKSSEITPESVYLNRRQFMKGVGVAALGGLALAACGPAATPATETGAATCASAGHRGRGNTDGGR